MDAVHLLVGKVRVLRNLGVIRADAFARDTADGFGNLSVRKMDGSLRYDVANAVADEDLDGDAGVRLFGISQVDKSASDAVGHLVGVRGIHFFKHNLHPFLARSKRSMRSSCGETSP